MWVHKVLQQAFFHSTAQPFEARMMEWISI